MCTYYTTFIPTFETEFFEVFSEIFEASAGVYFPSLSAFCCPEYSPHAFRACYQDAFEIAFHKAFRSALRTALGLSAQDLYRALNPSALTTFKAEFKEVYQVYLQPVFEEICDDMVLFYCSSP